MSAIMELIPIGTVLALLTNQVLETAQAAKDILIEKESFKALSKYLYDIELVLKELELRELRDSSAARQTLEFLKEDVDKANNLVKKYKNRSPFYLLVKCRNIVREVQDVTRDIGRSLAALSLANTEILSDISEKVKILHDEMQRAEFGASQCQLRIVEKLDRGLQDQTFDRGFANDMLEEIARAVGVPVEPSEIGRELENFRREKEEAAARKERAEALFLQQVIELLSKADAANDQEEIAKQYSIRVKAIEKYTSREEYIPPLKSFKCPLEGTVMVDPVSLCTGTTFERVAIQARLNSGQQTDPETGQFLDDLTLRPNVLMRHSIEEWRELNYCLKIRSAKEKLMSGADLAAEEAFGQIHELIKENPINKDWIALEGLVDLIVPILGTSHNREVKIRVLITLMTIVEGHCRNKDRVVESGGLYHVVRCLGRDPNTSKPAVELLFELLQDSSGWNLSVSQKLIQQNSAILFLVVLRNGPIRESGAKAEEILLKLCDDSDENISRVAAASWYKPLINRLCEGSESSRISMARTLEGMELVDQNIKLLGAEGVISPLVEMISKNLDSIVVALSALVKLSICQENKKLIAEAGAVPLILEHMFSSHLPIMVRARCSEILARLSSDDGIEFLVDTHGARLELNPIVTNLLAILQNRILNPIRKPALHALLGIFKSEERLVKMAVTGANGVSIILPLLEDANWEIREVAINLLFCFSQHEPQGIADFLLVQRRLESFMQFFEDDSKGNVQMAAAGLLANLPKSEVTLTEKLVKLDALPVLLRILRSGTTDTKENALSALFRFMNPANVDMQKMIVELGAYPLLVGFLESGTVTAKARAAALIGKLSSNSLKFSIPVGSNPTAACWCFRPARIPVCRVHGGICSMTPTFCMLETKALPKLVNLLREPVHETAYEALQALATLVEDDLLDRGAGVLHEAGAIYLILEILGWGTSNLKEEALNLLEKVFMVEKVAELYCSTARIPLVSLTTRSQEDGNLGRMAARVFSQLECFSRSRPLV